MNDIKVTTSISLKNDNMVMDVEVFIGEKLCNTASHSLSIEDVKSKIKEYEQNKVKDNA